jgi:hypothetical protein
VPFCGRLSVHMATTHVSEMACQDENLPWRSRRFSHTRTVSDGYSSAHLPIDVPYDSSSHNNIELLLESACVMLRCLTYLSRKVRDDG